MRRFGFALGLALAATATPSNAATFLFDATYDGTSVALNAGSTDPTGITLTAGDDIIFTLSAITGSGWTTNSASSIFPFLAFAINESGDRNVTYSLDFLRSGTSIFNDTASEVNSSVHFGTNTVSFNSGLVADAFRLSVDFESGDDATISELTPIFGTPDRNEFASDPSALTFGALSVSAVPEPSTWAMLMLGFGFIGGAMRSARRKRSITVSCA